MTQTYFLQYITFIPASVHLSLCKRKNMYSWVVIVPLCFISKILVISVFLYFNEAVFILFRCSFYVLLHNIFYFKCCLLQFSQTWFIFLENVIKWGLLKPGKIFLFVLFILILEIAAFLSFVIGFHFHFNFTVYACQSFLLHKTGWLPIAVDIMIWLLAVVPLDIAIKKPIGVCRWEASEGSCAVFFFKVGATLFSGDTCFRDSLTSVHFT